MIYFEHKNGRIGLIHYMPFDNIHGLKRSEDDLKESGVLVNEFPEPEPMPGKAAIPMYDKKDNRIYYEYEDHVPTPEQDEIEDLKRRVAVLEDEIKKHQPK